MIRRFRTSDVEAIIQLFIEVVHTTGAKYYDQEQVDAWAPKNDFDRGSFCHLKKTGRRSS